MKTTPEHLGEAFERARRHWRRHQPGEVLETPVPAARPALTVAISRECGAGGEAVARLLGARLDWPVYDRELIQKIAEESGLHTELLESVDEKRSNWLWECLEAFGGKKTLGSSDFAAKLAQTLLALASHGRCIVVGRGATVVLPESTTLRVRLVAPLKTRTRRTQEKFGIAKDEAARRVEATDAERIEFVRSHFHRDVTDVHQYELVLNTDRLSTIVCAELVMGALEHLQGAM